MGRVAGDVFRTVQSSPDGVAVRISPQHYMLLNTALAFGAWIDRLTWGGVHMLLAVLFTVSACDVRRVQGV